MSFEGKGRWGAAMENCRYAQSKLSFRGPKRSLKNEYLAFLGSTETYGKFVERPFPQVLEEMTGVSCVNLGWPNAGIQVMLDDPGLTRIASAAAMTVVQVPCAVNQTNGYYKVHPRRNDRFVKAEAPLRELYSDVDFTEFSFTRHMLAHLRRVSPDRFSEVQAELSAAWVTGMRRLIAEIRGPVALLWFSDRAPEQHADDVELRFDPALVSRDMLDALRRDIVELVEVRVAGAWRSSAADAAFVAQGLSRQDRQVMRDLPGQEAHAHVAEALIPMLARVLDP